MSYKISSKLVYFAALALSASAYANLVVSVPGPTNQWNPGTLSSESGDPFWAQKSADGSACNVGYWLQSTTWDNTALGNVASRCGNAAYSANPLLSGGPGKVAFLSGSSSSVATGWDFKSQGINVLDLKLEVAGNRTTNSFGWLINGLVDGNLVNSGSLTAGVKFSGANGPVTSKTINVKLNDIITFYICPAGNCAKALFSNTPVEGSNADPAKGGKFALLSEVPKLPSNSYPNNVITKYWIGVEDSITGEDPTLLENGGDYNDFVISATVVPEPGFYGVLSLGLGGLFMLVRRRRQSV